MKPRASFIINAACFFLVSPLLGMLVTGLVVGILEALMWTVACVAGLISSIFFNVDFTSISSRMPIIRQAEMYLILGGGTFGGIIWGCFEIKEKWQKHQANGKGW